MTHFRFSANLKCPRHRRYNPATGELPPDPQCEWCQDLFNMWRLIHFTSYLAKKFRERLSKLRGPNAAS